MKTILRLIMVALLFGVFYGGLVLKRENAELVRVSYGAGEFASVEQWFALTVAFGLGVVLTGLFFSLRLSRSWMVGRRYRKEITRLEKEVHGLRNLPVVEQGPPAQAEPKSESKSDSGVEVAASAGAAGSAAG